jgi:Ni,Fe-hydrogenase I large subunit
MKFSGFFLMAVTKISEQPREAFSTSHGMSVGPDVRMLIARNNELQEQVRRLKELDEANVKLLNERMFKMLDREKEHAQLQEQHAQLQQEHAQLQQEHAQLQQERALLQQAQANRARELVKDFAEEWEIVLPVIS